MFPQHHRLEPISAWTEICTVFSTCTQTCAGIRLLFLKFILRYSCFCVHAGNDKPYNFTHLKQDKSTHVVMVSWMNSIPRLSSSWPSPLPLLVHSASGFLPRLRSPPGSSKASKWTSRSLRSPEIMNKWLDKNRAGPVMLLEFLKA